MIDSSYFKRLSLLLIFPIIISTAVSSAAQKELVEHLKELINSRDIRGIEKLKSLLASHPEMINAPLVGQCNPLDLALFFGTTETFHAIYDQGGRSNLKSRLGLLEAFEVRLFVDTVLAKPSGEDVEQQIKMYQRFTDQLEICGKGVGLKGYYGWDSPWEQLAKLIAKNDNAEALNFLALSGGWHSDEGHAKLIKQKKVKLFRWLLVSVIDKKEKSQAVKWVVQADPSLLEDIRVAKIGFFLEKEDEGKGVLELLLNNGLDLKLTGEEGETLLHYAAKSGREWAIELLLKDHPELVNQPNNAGLFPHHFLMKKLKTNMRNKNKVSTYIYLLRKFIEKGTSKALESRDVQRQSQQSLANKIVHLVQDKEESLELLQALHDKGVSFIVGDDGNLLHTAISSNRDDVIDFLLENQFQLCNEVDTQGETPAFACAKRSLLQDGQKDRLLKLIRATNAQALQIETHGATVLTRLLNDHGNLGDKSDELIEVLQALKHQGVDFNSQAGRGVTALHIAVRESAKKTGAQLRNLKKIIEALLELGASPDVKADEMFVNLKTFEDITPLQVAKVLAENESPNVTILQLLQEKSVDPNIKLPREKVRPQPKPRHRAAHVSPPPTSPTKKPIPPASLGSSHAGQHAKSEDGFSPHSALVVVGGLGVLFFARWLYKRWKAQREEEEKEKAKQEAVEAALEEDWWA